MSGRFKLQHAACLLVLTSVTLARPVLADPKDEISQKTIDEIKAIEAAKATLTPVEAKVSFDLLGAVRESQHQPVIKGVPSVRASALRIRDNKTLILVHANVNEDIKSFVTSRGGIILAESPRYGLLSLDMPLDKILELAQRPDVTSIESAPKGVVQQTQPPGFPIYQNAAGDIAHAGAAARARFGVKGKGVKVCVMSDGVAGKDQAKLNGSLPADIDIVPGQDGPNNQSEGAAMLEIIHGIARDASLGFATAYNSEGYGDLVVAVSNVDKLVARQCNIIVDDLVFANQDPFQEGAFSDAVKRASDAGILYFSSAGNYGNRLEGHSSTWEGEFRSDGTTQTKMGQTGELLNFEPPSSPYTIAENSVLSLSSDRHIDLFWNDPKGATANVYDLFAANDAGDIVYTAIRSSLHPQDPYTQIFIDDNYDFHGKGLKLIVLKPTSSQVRFLHIDAYKSHLFYNTNGSIRGHNASGAPNAFTVAAISAKGATGPFHFIPPKPSGGPKSNEVEDYSSDGPRRIFYEYDGSAITPDDLTATGGKVLLKPDVTAADCVGTDLAGFESFCGTSAAAPNAAAIAALAWSYNRDLKPDRIRLALQGSTIPMGFDQWSDTFGYGIVMADAAVEIAASIKPAAISGPLMHAMKSYDPIDYAYNAAPFPALTLIAKDHKVITLFLPRDPSPWLSTNPVKGFTPEDVRPFPQQRLSDPVAVGMIGLDSVVLNRDGSVVRFNGLNLRHQELEECHPDC